MATTAQPTRIAILGGGAAALSTAFALTAETGWEDRYAITIYQQGWRLGGKGASSRNPAFRHRNEEHGLHVLGGYYHNCFALLRACYAEWRRVGTHPIPFDRAFVPQRRFTLEEAKDGRWRHVHLRLPFNKKLPGDPPQQLTLRAAVQRIADWIRDDVVQAASWTMADDLGRAEDLAREASARLSLLAPSADTWSDIPEPVAKVLLALLKPLRKILITAEASWRPNGCEPNVLACMAIACIYAIGLLTDCRSSKGLDAINSLELREWAAKHGATASLIESPYMRAGYDYAFAYRDGVAQPQHRAVAAGVAVRASLRMLLTYHGALFWHMAGGMGEIVFVPLYEVLRARGVKFRFFHRILSLHPGPDRRSLARIEGLVQAVPKADYDPLISWRDRRCWPAKPKYEELVDGDQLQLEGDDLESWWSPDRPRPRFSLERGVDFDVAVLAIPVGALGRLTAPLARINARWRRMLRSAHVVPTAGVQMWSKLSAADLGWLGDPALVTAYDQPLNTWADLSFLLDLEEQPKRPFRHLAYLCGPLSRVTPPADVPGSTFPKDETDRLASLHAAWLERAIAHLLPDAIDEKSGKVRPELAEELHLSANVSPSDCYVLSLPGSIDRRLRADKSGFEGLYLAGDWIRTGFDAGAIEAATIAGLQCARALGADPAISGQAGLL